MIANKDTYMKLQKNTECMRPIGGHCVGNCRKAHVNAECMRPIGGHCVGNCRKTTANTKIDW